MVPRSGFLSRAALPIAITDFGGVKCDRGKIVPSFIPGIPFSPLSILAAFLTASVLAAVPTVERLILEFARSLGCGGTEQGMLQCW
jgi:hypothetical protein